MLQLNSRVPKPGRERGKSQGSGDSNQSHTAATEMREHRQCKGPQGAGRGAGAERDLEGREQQVLRTLVSHATEQAVPRGNRNLAKDSAGRTGIKCVLKEK